MAQGTRASVATITAPAPPSLFFSNAGSTVSSSFEESRRLQQANDPFSSLGSGWRDQPTTRTVAWAAPEEGKAGDGGTDLRRAAGANILSPGPPRKNDVTLAAPTAAEPQRQSDSMRRSLTELPPKGVTNGGLVTPKKKVASKSASASKTTVSSSAKRLVRSASLNSSLVLRRDASPTKVAVAAALKALQHKPPTLPLIQALMRYSTYGSNLDAFQEASKAKKNKSSTNAGGKKVLGLTTSASKPEIDPTAGSLKKRSDSEPLAYDYQQGGSHDATATADRGSLQSLSSDEEVLMALKKHYGEADAPTLKGRNKASSFDDDTVRRLEQGEWARQAGGHPNPMKASERRSGGIPATRAGAPASKGQDGAPAGMSGSGTTTRRMMSSEPGLAFSTRQYQPVAAKDEGGGGAEMLQRQMAQMAAAMAGMGGLQQSAGAPPSVGNGFQASSVMLWEVMSLVMMRSVLSSAVGAMSTQMTSMAQQVCI